MAGQASENAPSPEVAEKQFMIMTRRALIGAIFSVPLLVLGIIAENGKNGARIDRYDMPAAEKSINDDYTRELMQKEGFALTENGDAVSTKLPYTKLNLKNGKVVRMVWPGSRVDATPLRNGEDWSFVTEIQNPQRIPIHEGCVEKAEALRQCIKDKLGLNPRVNFAYRSQASQKAVCAGMKAKDADAPCGEDGAGHTAGCAMDISSADAVLGPEKPALATTEAILNSIPYKVENGRAVFIGEIKDPVQKQEMALRYADGLVGVQDLAMECGLKNGFFGGFCSYGRDPWHYEEMDHLNLGDPRRFCVRGSPFFNDRYEELRKNPRNVNAESLLYDFSWSKARRLITDGIRGAGKRAYDYFFK